MAQTARSRVPSLLLSFLVLTVVVVNASNWFILSRVAESLDEGLGLRLTTVAGSAVRSATAELLLAPDVATDTFVRAELEDIARQQDLEDIFLVDPSGTVLWNRDGDGVGKRHPFLDLDEAAFASAIAGTAAASPALEVDGALLKAAYAPVADWDGGVEAALGVTAGGGFYARVPALRRTLLAVALGSAALVALLGVVFFGMSRRLSRTEAALAKSETLSAMGMMAAGVAHEVRNPLAIISGTASRLKRKYGGQGSDGDGGADAMFDFIPEEVDRLNRILEGYLRFARDEPITV
ncbi:MAG: hypothetical protein HKN12_00580, partial [Gemmatimonadetes bacterium]|nr:hypothetical protein [Gemmatimonadota bacterium]